MKYPVVAAIIPLAGAMLLWGCRTGSPASTAASPEQQTVHREWQQAMETHRDSADAATTSTADTPVPTETVATRAAVREQWRQAIAANGGDPDSIPESPFQCEDIPAAAPAEPATPQPGPHQDNVRERWQRAIEERAN